MQLDLARELALRLMAQHKLSDWAFSFNRRKKALGVCNYPKKTIYLSEYFVGRNGEDKVRLTILHEIAHALAGDKARHGPIWRRIVVSIGGVAEVSSDADMPLGKWQATCANCGKTHGMSRRPKVRYRCLCRAGSPLYFQEV